MSKIDEALNRLDAALARLEDAVEGQQEQENVAHDPAVPALRAERDELHNELSRLRSRADEDAKLRAEAASAVREALTSLRGVVTSGMGQGAPANA